MILDWFTDPMKDAGVTGTGAAVSEETQQAQLLKLKELKAAGITDQDAIVKLLQQVEKDVDPDNAKFQTEVSKKTQNIVNPQDTVGTDAGFDRSGLETGIAVLTTEQKAMLEEAGVAVDGLTEGLDDATKDLKIIGSNGIEMDAEPIMSAADIVQEQQVYDKTTGSQSGRYNQNVTFNVEGNMDKVVAEETTKKMQEIADDTVTRVYNQGNRKGS